MTALVEIAVEGADGLVAAQNAGADRVELCAGLLEGGLTPSMGMVRAAQDVARIPFFVMVRPRGGDFLYSDIEFAAMLADVAMLKSMGVAGIVIGCLTAEGTIDEARTRALVEAARPMQVTNHRAFDMTRDYEESIEALVRCGVDRVMTGGRHKMATEGIDTLARTVAAARGRIRVIACGGLNRSNIAEVYRRTQADEFHFAAPRVVDSPMRFRNPAIGMGRTAIEREFSLTITDEASVRATIASLGGS
ncbi:copper homeostasis protein CutC [Devosia sp. CN2-171]|uniref:copper homeostasis protein CutC n=1 Tax=Devosia sp. CN2-171 TaxID=3400909 RepID=UPI003BF8A524